VTERELIPHWTLRARVHSIHKMDLLALALHVDDSDVVAIARVLQEQWAPAAPASVPHSVKVKDSPSLEEEEENALTLFG